LLLNFIYQYKLFENDCFNLLVRKTDEALNDKPGQTGRALQKT